MESWNSVTVGVADLDQALVLWRDEFGMEVRGRRDGPDPELGRLWDLDGDAVARQALLGSAGEVDGLLHLVEFSQPAAAVREGAQVFDLCPKNLDIYVDDLPRRYRELQAAGHHFHTESWSDVTAPNGIRFREIHMPSHDYLNVVLLEVVGSEQHFPASGFAAVGPLVTIVGNAAREKDFYARHLGLSTLSENILAGPEIEKMVGLPPGAALDVSIMGSASQPLAEIEIIDYRGVEGDDRYPRTQPPARGILHVTYRSADLDGLVSKLDTDGLTVWDHGSVDVLPGSGRAVHFFTPAGFRIQVISE